MESDDEEIIPATPQERQCVLKLGNKRKRRRISIEDPEREDSYAVDRRRSERASTKRSSAKRSKTNAVGTKVVKGRLSVSGRISGEGKQNPSPSDHRRGGSASTSSCSYCDISIDGEARSSCSNVVDLTNSPDEEYLSNIRLIEQVEGDEAIARNMQEELDKEYARLLNQEENNSRQDTGLLNSAANIHMINDIFPYGNNASTDDFLHQRPSRSIRHGRGRGRGRGRANEHRSSLADFLDHSLNNSYESLWQITDMLGDAKEKGLTASEINRLPTKCILAKDLSKDVKKECHVCMCDYEIGDKLRILPCFHSYHTTCIDKWIQKESTCPVCRIDIKMS